MEEETKSQEKVRTERRKGHTIYRPQNLKAYVDENGKIPVLLYANGACANNNLEMSRLLSEVDAYGKALYPNWTFDRKNC